MNTGPRETRIHGSLLAAAEKRLLVWLADRLPAWVASDHLTALGAIALLFAGICYAIGRSYPAALVAVVVLLAAELVRRQPRRNGRTRTPTGATALRLLRRPRPRRGRHALRHGRAGGGRLHEPSSRRRLFSIAYYLLTIEIALATHALGYVPALVLEGRSDRAAHPAGHRHAAAPAKRHGGDRWLRWLLFDVGGVVAVVGLFVTFVSAAIGNTRELYRREPLPGSKDTTRQLLTANA